MRGYRVFIDVTVTDEEALKKAAVALSEKCGFKPGEYLEVRERDGDPVTNDVVMLFDHGSPFDAGVQIERSWGQVTFVPGEVEDV